MTPEKTNMKECALCSQNIDHVEEPALLFIGKYGRRYEICLDCEELMDTVVSPDAVGKEDAVKTVYGYLFNTPDDQKSPELVSFFVKLLDEDSEMMREAQESLSEYEREEEERRRAAEEAAKTALEAAEDAAVEAHDDALPTEEEFIKDETKPVSLGIKLLFMLLFTLLAGGAIAYGVIRSHVLSIVIGAIILILGGFTAFSKD